MLGGGNKGRSGGDQKGKEQENTGHGGTVCGAALDLTAVRQICFRDLCGDFWFNLVVAAGAPFFYVFARAREQTFCSS
jgi:hypothetical protein